MEQNIYGLSGAAKVFYAYEQAVQQNRPVLYITFNEIERAKAAMDLSSFMKVNSLEGRSSHFMENTLRQDLGHRIDSMMGAIKGESIVASVDALLSYLPPKDEFLKSVINIKVNDELEIEDLKKALFRCGYELNELAGSRMEFANRGDIVDVGCGYRIEFFDNVVYSIKKLDLQTQRSSELMDEAVIYPVTTCPLTDASRLYNAFSKEHTMRNGSIEAADSKMAGRIETYMAAIEKGIPIIDIENYAYYAYENPATIVDYMEDPIIICDDMSKLEDRLSTVRDTYLEKFVAHFKKGQALIFHENALNFTVLDGLNSGVINLCEFGESKDIISTKTLYYKPSMGKEFFDFMKSGLMGYKTYVFCGNETRAERFIDMLREQDIGAFYNDSFADMEDGRICVLPQSLSGSFELSDRRIRFISDQAQPKKKQTRSTNMDVFADLSPGDYVVHDVHGIGRYLGIKSVTSMKKTRDYLSIEYKDGGMLYLPTDQLDRLQKYIGSGEQPPRLSKIGGKEWKKVKERVSKNVEDMAEDLVRLYADRSSRQGYAFSQDTSFQKEFEDSFEYEDTPDQVTSVKEIKADMEKGTIMDRLLCGDVGYGKTEVAIRAMFKCVMDGKQAAMLAPTVVLAKQHFNTVSQRLLGYPIRVALLSRFSSPAELKDTENKLRTGEIDIVIGTHKLLNKAVKYKDLGLLVVDEEQRFGVKHKEQIKMLKHNVGVLTLSATPIPRTLYMSLIGIRDISVINTPPVSRQTVATYVMEYSQDLAVDAIIDEIQRGGQVYFLYNDVANIDSFAFKLSESLPGVVIDVGHGQMNKEKLDKVMLDFYSGKTQVLVCSTIIESGLDVSNANTIIVYDADRFGLSQLYQLRGRVGRGEEQAYAYFTYRGSLSEKAHKRLSAIRDFTEFGSGYKIAMRDLEIRGAGNVLGSAQSGNLTAVGYDMYCRLIQSAVNKIQGTTNEPEFETAIKLNVDAFIPPAYISKEDIKIEVYKRIALIESREEAASIALELTDRFGKLPGSVNTLLEVAVLKAVCKRAGIYQVEDAGFGIVLCLNEDNNIDNGKLLENTNSFKFTVEKDYKIRLWQKEQNEIGFIKYMINFIECVMHG